MGILAITNYLRKVHEQTHAICWKKLFRTCSALVFQIRWEFYHFYGFWNSSVVSFFLNFCHPYFQVRAGCWSNCQSQLVCASSYRVEVELDCPCCWKVFIICPPPAKVKLFISSTLLYFIQVNLTESILVYEDLGCFYWMMATFLVLYCK